MVSAPEPSSSRRYAWYVLGVLSVINLMNYVDRQIMFSLYPYVQDELAFSDFQLGLLGAAFLIVHSMFSIPGGLLADKWYKRKVISIGVALWSVATVLGGIARSFWDLFTYRALVGVGEAAYHPAANAMISDYFPPAQRGRAMGVFSVGMVIGGGGGMILGTAIADYLGWRYAFLAAGIPGFLLAILAWRLRERRPVPAVPPGPTAPEVNARSGNGPEAPESAPATPAKRQRPRSWRRLWSTRTVRYNFAGGICVTFAIGGFIAWTVSFLDRYYVHQPERSVPAVAAPLLASVPPPLAAPALAPVVSVLDGVSLAAEAVHEVAIPRSERATGELAKLSASFGIVALLAGILGAMAGGWLADRLMRRRRSGRLLVSAAGFILGSPFIVGGIFAESAQVFLVCIFFAMFLYTWYMGPSIAILHDVVPYRYRATIAAWYIFAVHLLGDAVSPPVIGWLSQQSELRYALLLPVGVSLVGSLFFLLATRTVARDMEAAAAEGSELMGADTA